MSATPKRYAKNAPGRWFVTDRCLACIDCTEMVPTVFGLDVENGGYSFVRRQPQDAEEEAECKRAQKSCPHHAIYHTSETHPAP